MTVGIALKNEVRADTHLVSFTPVTEGGMAP